MNKKLFLKIFILLGLLGVSAFAGTGGSEVNDWYNDISAALQGTWGKIIAVAFLGLTIILFKGGAMIPDMVDARYTAIMMETSSINYLQTIQNILTKVY